MICDIILMCPGLSSAGSSFHWSIGDMRVAGSFHFTIAPSVLVLTIYCRPGLIFTLLIDAPCPNPILLTAPSWYDQT